MAQLRHKEEALQVADAADVQLELGIEEEPVLEGDSADPALQKLADEFVQKILEFNPDDASQSVLRSQNVASVENLGAKIQKESALRSAMLKEPIQKLASRGEDGGEVANALVDLNMEVEELDPGKFDFEAGWFPRMFGFIPGVGKPIKRYFMKFESSQTVLDAIFRSLEDGADMLKRDNITLTEDQKKLRELSGKLRRTINLGQIVDQRFNQVLEQEIPSDDSRYKFIEEELLFPLRQRLMDLQQQLAVTQQAVLAIEIITRNNKELIRGVNRAINVTANALNVAVTVALALANQRIVLNKIESVNETTNKLIGDTARQLKEQGTEIHKQAASSQLDMESLKQAFADINAALDDISHFRQKALPKMASTLNEMDQLTLQTDEAITRLEKGTEVNPVIYLEID
ncbi:toxic anion resistance protein [Desulfogranum japonicum]|uniref:toxic anion resistance protein n=1 Tax=Desulfogranum japonicum TaxID=231447 RepID=UPI0003FFDD71|nr:toxic anion resistance protein [Desulfogranum japonicum]